MDGSNQAYPLEGQVILDIQLLQELPPKGPVRYFHARQVRDNRPVRVALFQTSQPPPRQSFAQIQQDAQRLLQLRRSSLVCTLLVDWVPQLGLFWVFRGSQGESLEQQLQRQKRLSVYEAGEIFGQITNELEELHQGGILHRALSPAAFWTAPSRRGGMMVKCFDIGISWYLDVLRHQNDTRASVDYAGYMAPEQFVDPAHSFDPRVDVYACAAVLMQCLTGMTPFGPPDNYSLIRQQQQTNTPFRLRQLFPKGNFSAKLEEVLSIALHPNQEQRYASMASFGQALQEALREPSSPSIAAASYSGLPAVPSTGEMQAISSEDYFLSNDSHGHGSELFLDGDDYSDSNDTGSYSEVQTAEEIRRVSGPPPTPAPKDFGYRGSDTESHAMGGYQGQGQNPYGNFSELAEGDGGTGVFRGALLEQAQASESGLPDQDLSTHTSAHGGSQGTNSRLAQFEDEDATVLFPFPGGLSPLQPPPGHQGNSRAPATPTPGRQDLRYTGGDTDSHSRNDFQPGGQAIGGYQGEDPYGNFSDLAEGDGGTGIFRGALFDQARSAPEPSSHTPAQGGSQEANSRLAQFEDEDATVLFPFPGGLSPTQPPPNSRRGIGVSLPPPPQSQRAASSQSGSEMDFSSFGEGDGGTGIFRGVGLEPGQNRDRAKKFQPPSRNWTSGEPFVQQGSDSGQERNERLEGFGEGDGATALFRLDGHSQGGQGGETDKLLLELANMVLEEEDK